MRLATLLLLLLAAPASAQTCTPDPTPPESYYPLGVGDEWVYHVPNYGPELCAVYLSRHILGTETVGHYEYTREQTCVTDAQTSARTCLPERRVRFDGYSILALPADGQEWIAVEGLSRGLGPAVFDCAADLGTGPVVIGGTGYSVPQVKALQFIDFSPPALASGIGPVAVSQFSEDGVFFSDRFEYARVGSVEYGVRPPGISTPDPTPPADYYPLEVGNEWIYFYSVNSPPGYRAWYERRQIVGQFAAFGKTYAVETHCQASATDPQGWACILTESWARFDTLTTNVYVSAGGPEQVGYCNLGADFGAPLTCDSPGSSGLVYVDLGPGVVDIGGTPVPYSRAKVLGTLASPGPPAFLAGIGPDARPVGPLEQSRIVFARVRGVEYGQRPVSGETEAPGALALAVRAAPNPTSGALALTVTLPEAQSVTAEAFDALGRRVARVEAELPAGASAVPVDAAAWAPGLYVVRVHAGSSVATARVLRR